MRLIGSKTEQNFMVELVESHRTLFHEESSQRLLKVLKTYFNAMKTAYILNWTPEQGEDIYTFLVDTDFIVIIEFDRYRLEIPPVIEKMTINQYKKGLSKWQQIKLSVAIDLARKDLSL